jgi:hypothetical protein
MKTTLKVLYWMVGSPIILCGMGFEFIKHMFIVGGTIYLVFAKGMHK